jgi:hypothetical protein
VNVFAVLFVVFVVIGLGNAYQRSWWLLAPPWVAAGVCGLIAIASA